jgi:hypothetical protein
MEANEEIQKLVEVSDFYRISGAINKDMIHLRPVETDRVYAIPGYDGALYIFNKRR